MKPDEFETRYTSEKKTLYVSDEYKKMIKIRKETARYGYLVATRTSFHPFYGDRLSISEVLGLETPVKIIITHPDRVTDYKFDVWGFWGRFVTQAEDSSLEVEYDAASDHQWGTLTIGSTNDLAILRMMI